MKALLWISALAFGLFVPMFALGHSGVFNFWWWMVANIIIMMLLIGFAEKDYWKQQWHGLQHTLVRDVFLGLVSAGVLYLIFGIGNYLSRQWFPFAASGIENVYANKQGMNIHLITLLIAIIIGPGEELIWRGFFQRHFVNKYGAIKGVLIATGFYTLIHITSMNPMLIIAAAVCGLFWGILYIRYQSIALNILSHVVWDLTVFIIIPFH